MTEKEAIIKKFTENFVHKNKQERCYLELSNTKNRNKFIERLNHNWDTILDMRYFVQIDKSANTTKDIQKLLKFGEDDICYVISNYSDFDDKLLPFKEVFNAIYSRGLGTLLINKTADVIFLDTEQVIGTASKFIGKRIN